MELEGTGEVLRSKFLPYVPRWLVRFRPAAKRVVWENSERVGLDEEEIERLEATISKGYGRIGSTGIEFTASGA